MRFCIEVASVNYRERTVASLNKFGHANVLWEAGFKLATEARAIAGEFKTEWTAKDDAIGFDTGGKGSKSEENAFGDIGPGVTAGDFGNAFAVFSVDS